MKIGYDAKRIFHNFRGLGNYGRTLLEGMKQWYPENQYYLYTPPIADSRGLQWQEKMPHSQIITPSNGLLKKISPIWRSFFIGADLLKKNIDIYHGLSHELPVGIGPRIKKVVTIHDLIFLRHPSHFSFWDRNIYRKKVLHSCKSADKIIATSQQTRKDLMDFFNIPEKRIHVVYQSCHPSFYGEFPEEKHREVMEKYHLKSGYILYVGAIEPRKNIAALIDAYAGLPGDYQMILVGTGSGYKKKMADKIKKLKLTDRVLLLEKIPMEELPIFYQNARVFVYPSFFEGFGIPIIEALFSKTPVVTSKGSCFSEVGGAQSLYVNPHNTYELKEGILKVLSDDKLAAHMAQKGREFALKFHWKQTTQNIMDIYLETTAR